MTYEGDALSWIQRFKYPGRGLAFLDPTPLAVVHDWIRTAARRRPGRSPAWIVPIPVHAHRLRVRGFNPASLLARAAAREGPASSVLFGALVRTRDTPSQTLLGRSARRKNVAGAFHCPKPKAVAQRNIVLVDDVVTTGATLQEAAQCLHRAGAKHIEALCIARAALPLESIPERLHSSIGLRERLDHNLA